jgi:hypothetical protein
MVRFTAPAYVPQISPRHEKPSSLFTRAGLAIRRSRIGHPPRVFCCPQGPSPSSDHAGENANCFPCKKVAPNFGGTFRLEENKEKSGRPFILSSSIKRHHPPQGPKGKGVLAHTSCLGALLGSSGTQTQRKGAGEKRSGPTHRTFVRAQNPHQPHHPFHSSLISPVITLSVKRSGPFEGTLSRTAW